MTQVQNEGYMMRKVQHEGHVMATVHRWMQTHCRGHPRMLHAASWSAVRSFPPLKLIGMLHITNNSKHGRGCPYILSTNEECSGCWERLWRSPLWKIQVMYLLMMEVVSLWDTRTRWTYAAKIWQFLMLHLSRHPKGIREEEQFWLEERRKRVRGYDSVPGREEPHRLRGSM